MGKVELNGQIVDFDGAVALMDDETREAVHDQFAGESEQDFILAYAAAHREKFGEIF